MDTLVKILDENLTYQGHEIIEDKFYINVVSNRTEVECPFCGTKSSKQHSYHDRKFYDLPIQDKKTVIHIKIRKMICDNPECSHKTFTERFDCVEQNGRYSKRLENKIIEVSINMSSISASKVLSKSFVDIKKSAICNLLKKNRNAD